MSSEKGNAVILLLIFFMLIAFYICSCTSLEWPNLFFFFLFQMLVDDIGDVTITNDGATILKMLEVEHPAAKVGKQRAACLLLCFTVMSVFVLSHRLLPLCYMFSFVSHVTRFLWSWLSFKTERSEMGQPQWSS